MITGYTRPQLTIKQVLDVIADTEERTLHALATGPQFDLFRYTNADERAAMTGTAFVKNTNPDPAERQLIAYEGLEPTHVVDTGFVKLYGENLEGQLWAAESADLPADANEFDFRIPSLSEPNKVKVTRRGAILLAGYNAGGGGFIDSVSVIYGGTGYDPSTTIEQAVIGGTGTGAYVTMTTNASGVVVSAVASSPGVGYTADVQFEADAASVNVGVEGSTLLADLHGREVKAGDILYTTFGGNTIRRTVTGVEKDLVPSHYGVDNGKSNKLFGASNLNPITSETAAVSNKSAPPGWSVNLAHSSVLGINVTAGGGGYTTVPTIGISSPLSVQGGLSWPTQQAAATAVTASGVVTAINMDVIGSGYFTGGLVGFQITNGGSGYSSVNPPTITIGAPPAGGIQATATAVIVGGVLTDLNITDPGAGYTSVPTITVVGGGGTGAAVTGIINNGAVRSVAVSDPGAGYATPPVVDFTAGAGSGAAATAYLGVVTPVVNAGGTGYIVGDVVTVSGGTAVTAATLRVTSVSSGVVTGLEVVEMGAYSAIPTDPASTTGAGADDLTVDLDWGVSLVVMTTHGSGYLEGDAVTPDAGSAVFAPDIVYVQIATITGGGGAGATATLDIQSVPEDWSGLLEGAIYDNKYGERYTLTVTTGGSGATSARVRIRSNSGTFTADDAVAYHYGLGYLITHSALGGLVIDLRPGSASTALVVGQTFTFVITGKYKPLLLQADGQVSAVNIIDPGDYSAFGAGILAAVAPPPAGGTNALVTLIAGIVGASINTAGSGYVQGETLTIAGGTGSGATVTITSVGGSGEVTGVSVATGGAYTAFPSTPNTPTGGSGTGCQLDLVFGITNAVVGNPGSGYVHPPTVTITGGTATTPAVITLDIETEENASDLAVVKSGVFVGEVDTRYKVQVIRGSDVGNVRDSFGGARVRITDSAGIDTIQETDVAHNTIYPLGTLGLQFKFPTNTLSPSGLTNGVTATGSVTVGAGAVTAIAVTLAGSGYVDPPTLTIVGDGTGATAEATVLDGEVLFVTVTNGGSGYTSATVAFSAPIAYQRGLRKGDVYYIDAVAESKTGAAATIVLNGQVVDITGWTVGDVETNKLDIDLRMLFSGYIDPKRNTAPVEAWEAGDNTTGGILLKDTLAIEETERDSGWEWLTVEDSAFAKLYAHWRGLVPITSADTIKLYYSESEILEKFGAFDPDNPVCYGAIIAFRGAQGKPIYVVKTGSNDLAGYAAVLKQAERVDGILTMCPMSRDRSIQDAFSDHVSKVSAEDWKLWRRAYIATQNPGKFSIIDTVDGQQVISVVLAGAGGNIRVIWSGGDFITRGVEAGDLFRTNYSTDGWGDQTYEEYEILSVIAEDELLLKTGPAAPIDPAEKFEIWSPDNGASQADYAGEVSDDFLDRRTINVWCDSPIKLDADSEPFIQDPIYLAAEIAGLRSAVLPQQGLTYTELDHSVDRAPQMFTKYTNDDLDVAAAKGTMIVTQDLEDGPVYIRHQLTTETRYGSLYYEDSVGVNLDVISYAIKDILQPYIGKRNVNTETIEEIETKMRDVLGTFLDDPGNGTVIGPALLAFRDLSVAVDPVLRDRINISVTLELPLPVNYIAVTLRATTGSDETFTVEVAATETV